MSWCPTRSGALFALAAVICLALLPSCIIIDNWGSDGPVSYAIRWYNNAPRDVEVVVGGALVVWVDGSAWLRAWQELPSDSSFTEGTYPVQVFDHWNGDLVSQGTIYIGPGSQEFVTFR